MSDNIDGRAELMQERTQQNLVAVNIHLPPGYVPALDDLCADAGFTRDEIVGGLIMTEVGEHEHHIWTRRSTTNE